MAVTQTANSYAVSNLRTEVFDIAFDSSYPTGGEAFTLTHISEPVFGIATITGMGTNDGAAISIDVDVANKKLIVLATTGEVANATNCSDLTAQVVVFGR